MDTFDFIGIFKNNLILLGGGGADLTWKWKNIAYNYNYIRYNILNCLVPFMQKNKFIIIGNFFMQARSNQPPPQYDSFGFSPKPKYTINSYKDERKT